MSHPYVNYSHYSDVGYTVWFVLTTVFVVAIIVVGMMMATGTGWRRHGPHPPSPDRTTHGDFD